MALSFDVDYADTIEIGFPLSTENRNLVKSRFQKYWMLWCSRDFIPFFQHKQAIIANNGTLIDQQIKDPLIEKGFSIRGSLIC